MPDHEFELIVVGGGPGGYAAAIRGAQRGWKVALVERQHLGGVCLNWGCIPTKALLTSAEVYRHMVNASDYGLSAQSVSFDLAAVVARSRKIAGQLSAGVTHLLRKNKVTVFDGHGRLDGPGRVEVIVDGSVVAGLRAANVIVATGARARTVAGLEPDGKFVWTYREAMVPETMPSALLIVGSGAIGVEFASFFRAFGAQVTIVEMLPQILPTEDAEIAAHARRRLEEQGITIITDAKVTSLCPVGDVVTVAIEHGHGGVSELTVDRVISAVGVVGNVEGLGLETTAAVVERGVIITDGLMRSAQPGLYAIGDVAGPPMLAHKAQHEAAVCIEAIAGNTDVEPIIKSRIPGCIYSHPEIASIGLTEDAARAAGYELKIGRFPFVGNGRAIAIGEPDGLVKTIFDAETGQLLGAHMIGAHVTELIQGFVLAMNLETTEAELIRSIFPHPTLSETMHESVLAAYGQALHI